MRMPELLILGAIIRMTAPILLAGTGALYNDRAGVTNITLEGSMLLSAFFSVVCSYFTHNWVLSVIIGIAVGIIVSLIFYLATSVLGGDELVVGFAMNVLIDGLSIFLLKQIFHRSGSIVSDKIAGIPLIKSQMLASIPVIGDLLNNQTWIVYFSFICAILTYIVLYHTPFGLKILACGEKPQAAATVGINVNRIRFICNLINGALCGLAGTQISLGFLNLFTQGMTVGRGFIALGSVIFARGNPLRLIAITLFFGTAEAISNKVQLMQFPSELVLMLPYLAVVILTLIRVDHFKRIKIVKDVSEQAN
ncbi:ABC transporter permease [Petroclostridium sp. X23]|uniref:ABC transporter permease n=1 Tax=Petroclostridium sp. X23 TaxID=3045146 RepID=UPI0024AD17D5|nr:ABC transporter permease [Petroclostridium sp. X23]WHH61236.1 ABC transporter permease [Petroclostridium sp. X23]